MIIIDDIYVFIIDENIILNFLLIVKRIVVGLDGIGYWFWRDFVFELVFVIIYLFNLFIKL